MKLPSTPSFPLGNVRLRSPNRAWFRFLIVILLVLGVFFRFFNLDRKVYWHDEVYTSLRVSGYTRAEMIQQVFDGREIGVEDLQKYQQLSSKKGIADTIHALTNSPEHPPLYYLIARFWMQWFGNSVAVKRSLSALISLLEFPSLYWLCWELFESTFVAWVAIALMTISPLHLLYAQQAREYSLWTVTILLSSAALVRAVRLNKKLNWGIYAATLTLGLYTFVFTGLVAIGHGIHVLAIKQGWTRTVASFSLALLAAFLSFTPWLLVIATNFSHLQSTTYWTTVKADWKFFIQTWGLNVSYGFIDFGPTEQQFTYLVSPILLILVGFSLYLLVHQTPKQVWSFILTLIGIPAMALILPDLIWGGQRSLAVRYLIPCFLGIQLAVAYLLSHQLLSTNRWQQRLWQAITILLISCGIVSCTVITQADAWWSQPVGKYNYQIARIINQASHPLLITDASAINTGDVVSLSYSLDPKVKLQLVVDPNIPELPAFCRDQSKRICEVFLFYPSTGLQQGLEKAYGAQSKPIYEAEGFIRLWKLARPN